MATEKRIREEIQAAERFIDKSYLDELGVAEVQRLEGYEKTYRTVRLFHVSRIIYDAEENVNDKLISVFHSLFPFCDNVILLLRGKKEGIELYVGVISGKNAGISGELFYDSFLGNFPGSDLRIMEENETKRVFDDFSDSENEGWREAVCDIAAVNVVPSLRGERQEGFVQGLEKFVDTMRGTEYLCEILASPLSKKEMDERIDGFEDLYSALFPFSKKTMSHGHNEGRTLTEGISESIADSIATGISKASGTSSQFSTGTNSGMTVGTHMLLNFGFSKGTSESRGNASTITDTESDTRSRQSTSAWNRAESKTNGTTDNLTVEYTDKGIRELLEKADRNLKRLREGAAYGMWECAAYFAAEKKSTAAMAASSFRALMLGDASGDESSRFYLWGRERMQTKDIWESIRYCRHPRFYLSLCENVKNVRQGVTMTSGLNGKELALFFCLPRKSVGGLMVDRIAEFGRNVIRNGRTKGKTVEIGDIFHMGQRENIPVELDLESLTGHCFITGSTGSGKSNTVYRLIEKACLEKEKIPFLVIEPAKGEYRNQFRQVEGIQLFTTNAGLDQLLKLNPFSFPEKIHILEHLDRLVEIFNTCWEMYAAMPAILKEAVENAYMQKGWDLTNSLYVGEGNRSFPTFLDVLDQLPMIINRSGYSAETKGDYIGALVTRVRSLTNGIYGQIFCDDFEVGDNILFDQCAVMDLSRVGSSETKSLIMGIVILKLTEYRMACAQGGNSRLRHLTILEEAHNILKNTEKAGGPAGNSLITKSVEMITNSIAEMRTYGEGFIIVDQSPTTVDIAAIKNTNTKIIMRLPEQEDCSLAGNAASLNETQTTELARLATGVAVVIQNDWQQAVLCKIDAASHRFEAMGKELSFKERKAFKSAVIAEILNQFILEDTKRVEKIFEVIDRFSIDLGAKEEMKRTVQALCLRLKEQFDSILLGRSLLRLSGCSDLFSIAEKDIRTGKEGRPEPETIERWGGHIYSELDRYVQLGEGEKQAMIQYMLHAKRYMQSEISYDSLYREIYETREENGR